MGFDGALDCLRQAVSSATLLPCVIVACSKGSTTLGSWVWARQIHRISPTPPSLSQASSLALPWYLLVRFCLFSHVSFPRLATLFFFDQVKKYPLLHTQLLHDDIRQHGEPGWASEEAQGDHCGIRQLVRPASLEAQFSSAQLANVLFHDAGAQRLPKSLPRTPAQTRTSSRKRSRCGSMRKT